MEKGYRKLKHLLKKGISFLLILLMTHSGAITDSSLILKADFLAPKSKVASFDPIPYFKAQFEQLFPTGNAEEAAAFFSEIQSMLFVPTSIKPHQEKLAEIIERLKIWNRENGEKSSFLFLEEVIDDTIFEEKPLVAVVLYSKNDQKIHPVGIGVDSWGLVSTFKKGYLFKEEEIVRLHKFKTVPSIKGERSESTSQNFFKLFISKLVEKLQVDEKDVDIINVLKFQGRELCQQIQALMEQEDPFVYFDVGTMERKEFVYPAFIHNGKIYLHQSFFELIDKKPKTFPYVLYYLLYFSQYAVAIGSPELNGKKLDFSIVNAHSLPQFRTFLYLCWKEGLIQREDWKIMGNAERALFEIAISQWANAYLGPSIEEIALQDLRSKLDMDSNSSDPYFTLNSPKKEGQANFQLLFSPFSYPSFPKDVSPESQISDAIEAFLERTKSVWHVDQRRNILLQGAIEVVNSAILGGGYETYTSYFANKYRDSSQLFSLCSLLHVKKDKGKLKIDFLKKQLKNETSDPKYSASTLIPKIMGRHHWESRAITSVWPEEYIYHSMHETVLETFKSVVAELGFDSDVNRIEIIFQLAALRYSPRSEDIQKAKELIKSIVPYVEVLQEREEPLKEIDLNILEMEIITYLAYLDLSLVENNDADFAYYEEKINQIFDFLRSAPVTQQDSIILATYPHQLKMAKGKWEWLNEIIKNDIQKESLLAFQVIRDVELGETKQAKKHIWDYFNLGETKKGGVWHGIGDLSHMPSIRQIFVDMLSRTLEEDWKEEKDLYRPLRMMDFRMLEYLFYFYPDKVFSLLQSRLQSQQLLEEEVISILSYLKRSGSSSVLKLFWQIESLTEGRPKLKKYLQRELRNVESNAFSWDRIRLAEWLLSQSNYSEALQVLKKTKVKRDFRDEVKKNPFLKERYDIAELVAKSMKRIMAEMDHVQADMKKERFKKANTKLSPVRQMIIDLEGKLKDPQDHLLMLKTKTWIENLNEALPKFQKIFLLVKQNQLEQLAQELEGELKLSEEEKSLLPEKVLKKLQSIIEKLPGHSKEVRELREEADSLGQIIEETTFVPITLLKREVNNLNIKINELGLKKQFKAKRTELREKIDSRVEKASKKREQLEKAILKGTASSANQSNSIKELFKELLLLDLDLRGGLNIHKLFLKWFQVLRSRKDLNHVKEFISWFIEKQQKRSAAIRGLGFNLESQLKEEKAFIDIAGKRMALYEKVLTIGEWIETFVVEQRMLEALWELEEKLERGLPLAEIKKNNYDLWEEELIIIMNQVLEKKGITTKYVVTNDTFRLIEKTKKKKKETILVQVVETNRKEVIFSFPEYMPQEKKEEWLEKIKNGFYLERLKANFYLHQSEYLNGLIAELRAISQELGNSIGTPNIEVTTGRPHLDLLLGLNGPKGDHPELKPIPLGDAALEEDLSQYDAAQAGLHPAKVPIMGLVGPGGTGKTRVLTEILEQDYLRDKRVLVTSATHAAVDVIAAKLLDRGVDVIRVGSNEDRIGASLDEGPIKEQLLANWENREQLLRRALIRNDGFVLLGTATGYRDWAFRKVMQGREPIGWDKVVIDEAGKMAKPEALVAFKQLKKDGQLIFAGDPEQLPPFKIGHDKGDLLKRVLGKKFKGVPIDEIFSHDPSYLMYQLSFLEHAVEHGTFPVYHLKRGRRAGPVHVGLVQAVVYGNKLEPRDTGLNEEEKTEQDDLDVVAYNGNGNKKSYWEEHSDKGGVYNDFEVAVAIEKLFYFYNKFKNNGPSESSPYQYQLQDIRFISPYRAQLNRFDELLLLTALYFEFRKIGAEPVPETYWEKTISILNVEEKLPKSGDLAAIFIEGRLTFFRSPLLESLRIIQKNINAREGKNEEWRTPQPSQLSQIALSVDLSSGNGVNGEENKKGKEELSTTIHRAQGGEWPVVIFSLVRSNRYGNIGFLGTKEGPAFMTVGLTRQMEKLVVLVDESTFMNVGKGRFADWQRPFVMSVKKRVRVMIDFFHYWSKKGFGESWRTWSGGKRKELLEVSPTQTEPLATAV